MKLITGKVLRGVVLGALGGTLVLGSANAGADVLSCPTRDGSVRVWDAETNGCGRLSANNLDWRTFGWNDRMDQFGNDDWTRGRSMCLYKDINRRGTVVRLPVANSVTWRNVVSSNWWTGTSSCPGPA